MQAREHQFALYWPNAAKVELTGSFLPEPLSMSSSGDGWWHVAAPLPEQECTYCFIVDDRYRVPDYSAGEPQYDVAGTLVSVIAGAGTSARSRGPGRLSQGQGGLRRPNAPAPAATDSRGGHRPPGG